MSARVIQVIEVEATRGKGVEDNPIRRVMQYFSFDGVLLAEFDSLPPTCPKCKESHSR
jgi:hypothetical protein